MPNILKFIIFILVLPKVKVSERRKLHSLDNTNSRIPLNLLFVEDVYPDTITNYNPVNKAAYQAQDFASIFKLQPSSVSAFYRPSPFGSDYVTPTKFVVQTFDLLYPISARNEGDHNIFAFKNIDVSIKQNYKITPETDHDVMNIFWGVYLFSNVNFITEDLKYSPEIKGFETCLIYSLHENNNPQFLDSSYINWIVYVYSSYSSLHLNTIAPELEFPYIFLLYGNNWGYDLNTLQSNKLIIFFDAIDPLIIDEKTQEVSCSSFGLTILNCYKKDPAQLTSVTEIYNSEYYVKYSFLEKIAIEISFLEAPDNNLSWGIAFPWKPLSTATVLSKEFPMIGLMNYNWTINYLSGYGNGNNFGPGIDSSNLIFNKNDQKDIDSLKLTELQTQMLLVTDSYKTENSVWINLDKSEKTGGIASTAVLNIICSSSTCTPNNFVFALAMICFSWNFQAENFGIVFNSDESYNKYFTTLNYLDGNKNWRYCSAVLQKNEPSTYYNPTIIKLNNFRLSSASGTAFPEKSYGILFSSKGSLIKLTEMNFLGEIWSPNILNITIQPNSLILGELSQRLRFSIKLSNRIERNGFILLSSILSIGLIDILQKVLNDEYNSPYCYIKINNQTNSLCNYRIIQGSIYIYPSDILENGEVEISLYEVYVDSNDIIVDDMIGQLFSRYSIQSFNENSTIIDQTEKTTYLQINYLTLNSYFINHNASIGVPIANFISFLQVNILINYNFYENKALLIAVDGLSLDLNSSCLAKLSDGSIYTSVIKCKYYQSNQVFVLFRIAQNSQAYIQNFTLFLYYIVPPVNEVFVNVSIKTLGGFTLKESSSNPFSIKTLNCSTAFGDLKVYYSSPYNFPGQLIIQVISFDDYPASSQLYLNLSPHFEFDLSIPTYQCLFNTLEIGCQILNFGLIILYDFNENINSGLAFNLTLEGISSLTQISNTIPSISIYAKLKSFDYIIYSCSSSYITFLSNSIAMNDIQLLQTYNLKFSQTNIRNQTSLNFNIKFQSEITALSIFSLKFPFSGLALISKENKKSCLLYVGKKNYATNCQLMNNFRLNFNINSKILINEIATITITNVQTSDWVSCQNKNIEVQLYSNENKLIGSTAVLLHDSQSINFSSNQPYYNYQNDIDELPIGFYKPINIITSELFFGEEAIFIVNDKVLFSLHNETAIIGENVVTIYLGINENAAEGMRFLSIEKLNSYKEARLPIISVQYVNKYADFLVNNGINIFVSLNTITSPIPICLTEIPITSVQIDLNITTDDPKLNLQYLYIKLSHTQIILNYTHPCEFIYISMVNTRTIPDSNVYLSLISNYTFYNSNNISINFLSSETTKKITSIWSVYQISEFNAFVMGATNKESVSLVYAAPSSLFNNTLYSFQNIQPYFTGVLQKPDHSIFKIISTKNLVTSFEFNNELLNGIEYKYLILTLGQEKDIDWVSQGNFTTLSLNQSAIQISVSVNTSLLNNNSISNFLCSLATTLRVPYEVMISSSGYACSKPLTTKEFNSDAQEAANLQRTLQKNNNANNGLINKKNETEIRFIILAPVKKSQNYFITEMLMAKETNKIVEMFANSNIPINSIISIGNTSILLPEIINYFSFISTSNSVVGKGLEVNGTGSICYILYTGSGMINSKNDILTGNVVGSTVVTSSCAKLPIQDILFDNLLPSTLYSVAYFIQSIDTRPFSIASDIINVDVITTQEIIILPEISEDIEDNEECGLIQIFPILNLLFFFFALTVT